MSKLPLAISANGLEITVSDAEPNSDWVIAVESSSASPTLALGEVDLVALAPVGVKKRIASGLRDLDPKAYSISSGGLVLYPSRAAKDGVVAYARVPAGTRVRVTGSNGTIADTQVTDSLLVHAGVLLPEYGTLQHALLLPGSGAAGASAPPPARP